MTAPREHLLIDGYNLIKSSQLFLTAGDSLAKARHTLQKALADYGRRAGVRISLYYDGAAHDQPEGAGRGGLEVTFSRAPEKADDLIMRAAQAKHGAKWLRVISSDREIRRFARRHKIRSTAAEDFLDELEAPPPGPQTEPSPPGDQTPGAAADDLDEWERAFSTAPAQSMRERDGTEADMAPERREVEEWERLFGAGKADTDAAEP